MSDNKQIFIKKHVSNVQNMYKLLTDFRYHICRLIKCVSINYVKWKIYTVVEVRFVLRPKKIPVQCFLLHRDGGADFFSIFMTRHSVWNSLPKNVDFNTLTSFRQFHPKYF